MMYGKNHMYLLKTHHKIPLDIQLRIKCCLLKSTHYCIVNIKKNWAHCKFYNWYHIIHIVYLLHYQMYLTDKSLSIMYQIRNNQFSIQHNLCFLAQYSFSMLNHNLNTIY